MKRSPHALAVLLLSVVLVAGCSAGGARSQTAAPQVTTSPDMTRPVPGGDDPLSLLVIGDSYAAGVGADSPNSSFAWRLGQDLGADTSVDAVSGTGYVNPGGAGPDDRYGTRLSALTPDQLSSTVIVVEGGLNDRQFAGSDVAAAADGFLAHLVDLAPTATVVVFGATAPVPAEPEASERVNTVLAQSAARYGVTFVDPIGPDWFTHANAADLVDADQLHPTQAGHDFLARRIADVVEQLIRA